MPSNFLTEYRQRFSEFNSELNREKYLYHSGQKEHRETNYLYSEYSDLFSSSTIATLQQELKDAPAYRDTDCAALKLLIANATHENLCAKVRALTDEIGGYEARAELSWANEPISFHDSFLKLRDEPDAHKRADLYARQSNVINTIQDLRAERIERLHEAAEATEHTNYLALYSELRGQNYAKLATQCEQFLAATEAGYVPLLAPLLNREAHVTIDTATRADLSHFLRLARFDKHFPAWQLKQSYRETFSSLGIFTYKQDNIVIDDARRPRKTPRAFCFPVRVPDEIKLVINSDNSQQDFQAFFSEAGKAQQFGWTSRNLYPEFQYSGDQASRKAFALLFGLLLHDERWLSDLLSFHESHELRHLLAVQKLLRIRRLAAMLIYEVELHSGKLSGSAGARYSELLTDAVRVRYDETEHLRVVKDGFAVADNLRALAFEAQLREQLKTKFGSRWWTSRKAGDYLIDLWNTGGRYQAEEMAKMIDLGELSFDWLAEECLANIQQ